MDNLLGYHYMCAHKEDGIWKYTKRSFAYRETEKEFCERYDKFFENPEMKTSICKYDDPEMICIVFKNSDIALGFVNGMWFCHEKEKVWAISPKLPDSQFHKQP